MNAPTLTPIPQQTEQLTPWSFLPFSAFVLALAPLMSYLMPYLMP